jgi:hypothetical protein
MKPYLTHSLTFALALNTQAILARAADQPRAGKMDWSTLISTNITTF